MFIAPLFLVAKIWKQSKRPPKGTYWGEKTWYIQTPEYHVAIKNRELNPYILT